MDASLITKIAAAGSMGVSIYCTIKVYDLLKHEQRKDQPRPLFIKTIYISMAFAITMTFVSLGIEWARTAMGSELNELEKEIKRIEEDKFFSFDSNGTPKPITLTLDDKKYTLSNSQKIQLIENQLSINKKKEENYLINDGQHTLGFINLADIKLKCKELRKDKYNGAGSISPRSTYPGYKENKAYCFDGLKTFWFRYKHISTDSINGEPHILYNIYFGEGTEAKNISWIDNPLEFYNTSNGVLNLNNCETKFIQISKDDWKNSYITLLGIGLIETRDNQVYKIQSCAYAFDKGQ